MLFRLIYDDKLAQAAYLIGCQRTGEAIVIDPERDIDRYLKVAEQEKLRITAVAETHIHADFLSGTREVAERTGAKVYVSDEGDSDWKYGWLSKKQGGGSYPHQLLRDGTVFRIGNIQLTALHTPGHTPEHISFLVTDLGGGADEPMGVITGDFVFVGDMGRPDLLEAAAGQAGVKEQSARTLYGSAQRFLKLPEYLQVWPAHGAGSACGKALGAVPQSTVGYEKRFNSALGGAASDDEEGFVRNMLEGQPEPPLYFARMKRENRDGPALLPQGRLPQPTEIDAAALKKWSGPPCPPAGTEACPTILDTRPWPKFRAGHVGGSLNAPLNNQFPTVAGSFVEAGAEICLICEPGQVEECVRCLVRIGLDNVTSFATPQTLDAAAKSGLKLVATEEIDIAEFNRRRQVGGFVLDVRRASEYEAGHIEGAHNIAHTRLLSRLDEVPKDQPLLVHCQGGVRSALATALLERHGYTATNIAGGFGAWEKAGGKAVRETVSV